MRMKTRLSTRRTSCCAGHVFGVSHVWQKTELSVFCPSCGNNEMQLMPISDYESYRLDL